MRQLSIAPTLQAWKQAQKGWLRFPRGTRPDVVEIDSNAGPRLCCVWKEIPALKGFIRMHADVCSPHPFYWSFSWGLRKGRFSSSWARLSSLLTAKSVLRSWALAFLPGATPLGCADPVSSLSVGGCNPRQASSVHLAEPFGFGWLRSDRGLNERLWSR